MINHRANYALHSQWAPNIPTKRGRPASFVKSFIFPHIHLNAALRNLSPKTLGMQDTQPSRGSSKLWK